MRDFVIFEETEEVCRNCGLVSQQTYFSQSFRDQTDFTTRFERVESFFERDGLFQDIARQFFPFERRICIKDSPRNVGIESRRTAIRIFPNRGFVDSCVFDKAASIRAF